VILTQVYVHRAFEIGLDGDYCDRCDADAGVCTDGCEIGLGGTIVIYVMLTPVYVQTAVK
jgi:uncharacterized membrane protein (DUF485 family)